MTCDKEVSPSGTSTAGGLTKHLSVNLEASLLVSETDKQRRINRIDLEVLAIIANRFSFVFNMKGGRFDVSSHDWTNFV